MLVTIESCRQAEFSSSVRLFLDTIRMKLCPVFTVVVVGQHSFRLDSWETSRDICIEFKALKHEFRI